MAIILDTLLYAQRLQKAGVSQELAEAHAEITRDMVVAEVASRDDLKNELAQLRSELVTLEQKLINRITLLVPAVIVGMVSVAGGILTLVLKFLGK